MNQQEELVKTMKAEKTRLESIKKETEKRLKKAPEGTIRIIKCRTYPQFFLRTDPKDKSGKYIPSAEKKKVRDLVQKKYDLKMLKETQKQLDALNRFLAHYDPHGLEKCYYKINPEIRNYLLSAEEPNEVYAQKWSSEKYDPKPFAEGAPEHYTQKGERVRSKSEVIIANALYHANIPYRYEYPLNLEGILIHPDFTILRVKDRKIIYLEHLGLIDDTSYRNDAFSRIRLYEKNGIFIGDRLLLTFETYRQPVNFGTVNNLIRHYLQ